MIDSVLATKAFESAMKFGIAHASRIHGIPRGTIHKWVKRGSTPSKLSPGRTFSQTIKPTPDEIAWAAGLFEGEGSIILKRDLRGWSYGYLVVGITDKDVLVRFASICGAGHLTNENGNRVRRPHYKPRYDWQCTRHDDVGRLLELFLPWLGERRKRRAIYVASVVNDSLGSRRKPWKWQVEWEQFLAANPEYRP